MKITIALLSGLAVLGAATPTIAGSAEEGAARAKDVPTKVEYYYRIKWGSLDDFISLYAKNHAPLLEDMKTAGFVVDVKSEFPFTHLAGGPRWDMRVTVTYRDAAAAVNDPAWETAWEGAKKMRFKDIKKMESEESARFAMLEDHWDVIISDYPG